MNKHNVPRVDPPSLIRFYILTDPVHCDRVVQYKQVEMKESERLGRETMITNIINWRRDFEKTVGQLLVHHYRSYTKLTIRKIKFMMELKEKKDKEEAKRHEKERHDKLHREKEEEKERMAEALRKQKAQGDC